MTEEILIAKIRKGAANEIRINRKVYGGALLCDIREYFRPAESVVFVPTKKGVSIPLALLPEVVKALERDLSLGDYAILTRGPQTQIRVGVTEYLNHVYAEIRTYYLEGQANEEWRPGKGVTFPLAIVAPILEGLRLARDRGTE